MLKYRGIVVLSEFELTLLLVALALVLVAIAAVFDTIERLKPLRNQVQKLSARCRWQLYLRVYLQEVWRDACVATLLYFAVWTLLTKVLNVG